MPIDPLETQLDVELEARLHNEDVAYGYGDHINTIEASDKWSTWRDNLTTQIWNEWLANRHID